MCMSPSIGTTLLLLLLLLPVLVVVMFIVVVVAIMTTAKMCYPTHRYSDAEAAIQKSIDIGMNGMNLVTLGNIRVKLKK
jgi:hypothetical protein